MKRASETPFPYGWPGRVAYFAVDDGVPVQISGRDNLRSVVAEAVAGNVRLYAAWPGEYRTDLFLIDEPARLAEALGMAVVA